MSGKKTILHGLVLLLVSTSVAVDNPLTILLDGSIIRYNGGYYGMGLQTNGLMWTSDDLMRWGSPAQVLPPENAAPYDLIYRNGLFYLYAQDKGYAVSADPLASFSKVNRAGLSGQDMRLYQENSGTLFSVNRQLGSKKEGEIWLQRYADPWRLKDRPKQLLDGRQGMWDSLDSSNLGAPEIIDYRGNFYLLYVANHPGPRTGLREVGVAVEENPVRLDNTCKLPEPVLKRNAERLAYDYEAILPCGEYSGWEGRYTFKQPEEGWMMPDFKLSAWRTGDGGFGAPDEDNGAQIHACRTKWTTDQIWIRRTFDLPQGLPQTPVLKIRHEGAARVFLNGRRVYESSTSCPAYGNFDLSGVAAGAFRPQDNVLAVEALASQNTEFRFIDAGLYDARGQPVEPGVYGIDVPRFVEGRNGFEKWITYRAYWNGMPGTGMDRVFFFEKKLVIDGPTTAQTVGYHPPPAAPTFGDNFAAADDAAWTNSWTAAGDEGWATTNGVMRQTKATGTRKLYLKQAPAANYLFEANIRFPKDGRGSVGVVAFSDGQNDLMISINAARREWEYRVGPSDIVPSRIRLPDAFQVMQSPPGFTGSGEPFHLLRITKNGGHFKVMIDHIDLTREKPLITKLTGAGIPGLYCEDSTADFDGVVFTKGWDECGEYITGWGGAADGTPPEGDWGHSKDDGLEQKRHSEPGLAFKGDLLDQYEFTVNARTEDLEEGKERLYGVFPVFVDRINYLKAMIDTRTRELVVEGRRQGREIGPFKKSLHRSIPLQHLYDKDTSYRDFAAWVYSLPSWSIISGVELRWLEGAHRHLNQEFNIPEDDLYVRYANLKPDREPILWEDSRFYEADVPSPELQRPGVLNPVFFREVVGNHLGIGLFGAAAIVVNSDTGRYLRPYTPGETLGPNESIEYVEAPADLQSRPQEARITVEVESSYFFRCVKLKDRVIIDLNGQPMLEVKGEWGPSQVGLLTEGQPCYFNGITLMHLPAAE